MDVHQRDQPQAGKVFLRQRMAHVKRPGIPPRAAPVDARFPGALRVQAERAQARFTGAGAFPLPPCDDAQSTTVPLAGPVEDFHLQVGAPCRAHKKKGAWTKSKPPVKPRCAAGRTCLRIPNLNVWKQANQA